MLGVGFVYFKEKLSVDDDKPPVVKKMIGEYRFIVSDKVFLVPGRYVKSYGVKKSGGALDNFSVRFNVLNGAGEAEVIVTSDRRSKEAMEKYWYSNTYQYFGARQPGREESVTQEGESLVSAGGHAFLVKGGKVSRMLHCTGRICSVFASYSDKLKLYIVFDEKLRRDWLDLTAEIEMKVSSFERSGRALGR